MRAKCTRFTVSRFGEESLVDQGAEREAHRSSESANGALPSAAPLICKHKDNFKR
jgi:hypothetical protein